MCMENLNILPFFSELLFFVKKQFRRKKILYYAIVVLVIAVSIFSYKALKVSALSSNFVQTDWSGGADDTAVANDTNLSGWTKFFSSSDGVDNSTAGELKLKMTIASPAP